MNLFLSPPPPWHGIGFSTEYNTPNTCTFHKISAFSFYNNAEMSKAAKISTDFLLQPELICAGLSFDWLC